MNMVLALILYALASLFLPGANASPAYARFTAATGKQEAFGATYMQEVRIMCHMYRVHVSQA